MICVATGYAFSRQSDARTIQTFQLFDFDPFTLNGDVCPEFEWASFSRGAIHHHVTDYATGEDYKFHGTITKATVTGLSGPSVAVVPAPGAMLLAGFGASIVGWFLQKRLMG